MRLIVAILVVFLAAAYPVHVSAQSAEATATMDSAVIMIGDQVTLKLRLSVPAGSDIWWPEVIGDTLAESVEIVDRSKVDSTK